MPPLICASPIILDQSFPRNEDELRIVKVALGEIQYFIENDLAHVILTNGLRDIVESFDWNQSSKYDIYRLLDQWFLQKHKRLVEIDVSNIKDYVAHPIPKGCSGQGLVIFWADELGRMLVLHDRCCPVGRFFIGVGCERAFAGDCLGEYDNPNGERVFPLVGPENINKLAEAYEWVLPKGRIKKKVEIADIQRNYQVIGAMEIETPNKDSHSKVRFSNNNVWILDMNINPISEDHLPGLAKISGYPLKVIKYALINGQLPNKSLRFKRITK